MPSSSSSRSKDKSSSSSSRSKDKSKSKSSSSSSSPSKEKAKNPTWIPLQRDYAEERENSKVTFQRTKLHPLLSNEVLAKVAARQKARGGQAQESAEEKKEKKTEEKKQKVSNPLDPLSSSPKKAASAVANPLMGGGLDPLSALAPSSVPSISVPTSAPAPKRASQRSTANPADVKFTKPIDFEMWKDKTPRILVQYATNTRMPVSANFLEEEQEEKDKPVGDGADVAEAKNRLEQLEAEQGKETATSKMMMSQKEYIAFIEGQHDRLKKAWKQGDRVLALKIAIQCGKKLNDTSVPQLYPSMYVLLTAVLDTFGDLVFERIKLMGAVEHAPKPGQPVKKTYLPYDFGPSDVIPSAKETCRNWFYKTACIRELMPRMYCELALIKSYRFLGEEPFDEMLQRLSKTIRGLGDPLAAQYARCFLTTKCVDLWLSFSDPSLPKLDRTWFMPDSYQRAVKDGFSDFLTIYKSFKGDQWKKIAAVKAEVLASDAYIDLFGPSLEWMLQNIGYRANADVFFALLKHYRDACKNSMVLYHILNSFNPQYISKNATSMCTLIKESEPNSRTPKSKLYLSLGRSLVKVPPPKNQRLSILNTIWKAVTKIQDPKHYIEISEVFVQYLLMNFDSSKVDIFLKDVVKHVKPDMVYKTLQDELLNIVLKIVELSGPALLQSMAMDNFLPVFDLLDKNNKAAASKSVLQAFRALGQVTADPVIIHTLFEVSRSLHDSVDSLSFADERKQIGELIIYFIRGIDYGKDLEKQLSTFVECRQAFSGLDPVIRELILRVGLVGMNAHALVRGKHNKKTAAFVKACLAYCHITIPSLDDPFERLYLQLELAQVGLVNGMITQAEGFLKAAISLISLVPETYLNSEKRVCSNAEPLCNYLLNFASFLLLFPGHPTQGPFYLVKGLLNAVAGYEPWKKPNVAKARVYIGILALFCSYAQRNFPVHIKGVDSNDTLYAGDPKYLKALYSFVDILITGVVQQLEAIGAQGDMIAKKKQGELALDFVNLFISSMTMNAQSATAVVKLYTLAAKSDSVDKSYLNETMDHLQSKKGTWYQDIANMINKQLGGAQKKPAEVSPDPAAPL